MNKSLIIVPVAVAALAIAGGIALSESPKVQPKWEERLAQDLKQIDQDFTGEFGLYVKDLQTNKEFGYKTDHAWYLASTVKVFVAAATLAEVEKGNIKFDEKVTLLKTDFVDGSGDVIWKKPGERLSVRYLLTQMLTKSDSTATDILIRKIGVRKLNDFCQFHLKGLGPLTDIKQVRTDAYTELHPKAQKLTNLDFIAFKKVPPSKRIDLIARKLHVKKQQLKAESVEDAFERYYARGINSGSLPAFGQFIEQLLGGRILNKENTAIVTKLMESATTGENRLKAGLPKDTIFAQKTGTQIQRMCNVGRVQIKDHQAIVVMCLKGDEKPKDMEKVFATVGKSIAVSGIF